MRELAELTRSFNDQITTSNTVVLSEAVLGIGGLTELLAPLVPDQKSVIVKTAEKVVLKEEVVSFHGTLDFLNYQNSPLQVTLKFRNGDLVLELDITPTSGAALLDDFPILRTDQDYPKLITVKRYIFTTDSNSSTLKTGLNVEVVSKPFAYLDSVASLIPGSNSLKQINMTGHISLAPDSAYGNLALDVGPPEVMNLGLVKVSEGKVSLELSAGRDERNQWYATAAVFLSGKIAVAKLNVPVKAQFTPSGILFIEGRPTDGNIINLTELAGLFGNAENLNGMLPQPLQKLGTLSLDRVMLILDLAKQSIVGTAVDIQLQNWQASDFVQVNHIFAKWQWYASDNILDLSLIGVARIRDTIDIEVEINSQSAIAGTIRIDKGKSLESLVSDITGTKVNLGNFKDIEIGFISIAADLKQSAFELGFGAIAHVTIAPGIDLKQFEVGIRLDKEQSDSQIKATGNLLVGDEPILVTGSIGAQDAGIFIGDAAQVKLSQLAKKYLTDLPIQNLPDIVLQNVHLELSTTGKFKLGASVDIDLGSIGDSLGIPKPLGFPEISLDRIAIAVEPRNGAWSIEILSNKIYRFPEGGNDHADLSQVSLCLSKQQGQDIAIELSVTLAGKVSLGEILAVEFDSMTAAWNSAQSSWGVEGKVDCRLFGTTHKLIPDFIDSTEGTALKLTYASDISITIIKNVADVTIAAFSICLENRQTEKQGKQTDWSVGGACNVNMAPLMKNTPADLFLKSGSHGSEFGFSIGALSPITLDLAAGVKAGIGLHPFEIKYGKEKDKEAQWHANGSGSLALFNIPTALNKYFPIEELTIEIGFGSDEVYVKASDYSLSQSLPKLRVELPGDFNIDLGQPAISVEELSLHFGKELRLSQQLKVSGLSEINRIFGVKENGDPKQIILNPQCAGELSISVRNGIKARLQSSPFNRIPTRTEKDGSIWTEWWQIGDIIKVSVQIPEFAFDTNTATWSASGGILKDGHFKFPLTPLKWLLKQLKVDAHLVDLIPNGVPIRSPGGDLLGLLGGLTDLAGSNANSFKNLIAKIEKQLERLPSRFTEYATAEVPDGFQFDIETSTTGNIKFDISMGAPEEKDPKPIKLMFPCSAPLPEIVGVSLKRISLGELFGGSILLLEFDGYIDRFPLENLIGACLLPDEIMSQETANSLSYRIIASDITALIPAAAGVPFPIPVFYSQFGIEYHHLTGLRLQSHFKFPKPEGGFIEAIDLLSRLIEFFSDKKYLLHEQKAPQKFDLKFTLGENFIGLPDFLKCEPLGLTQELPAIRAYDNVSRLLDAMKTANLGYLIEAIPLRVDDSWIRVNKFNINFGPLEFEAAWCITTEQEFVNTVLVEAQPAGKLPDNLDQSVLKSLPATPEEATVDNGFIILLMGSVNLGPVAGLGAQIGMSLTHGAGFQTGFRLTGTIAQVLALEISGRVEADAGKVAIAGAVGLYWKEKSLIVTKGKIEVTKQSFNVQIVLELTPNFAMTGLLEIGSHGFYMKGNVQWQNGNQPKSGYSAELKIDGSGITIGFDLRLLEFDATIKIKTPGSKGQLFLATVNIIISDSLFNSYTKRIESLAKEAVAKGVNKAYDDVQNAVSKLDGLEVSISGLRDWLPDLCRDIAKIVDRNIVANTKGWKSPGRPVARKIAAPYVARVNKLGEIAEKADDKSIRPQLKAAINDILRNNHLKIGVPIPTPWKTYHIKVFERDLMDQKQVAQLKDAIAWIDKLPDQTNIRINSEKVYNQFPPREQMLGKIQRAVDKGIKDAVPKIESLGFETGLGTIDATNLKLKAVYFVSGNRHQVDLTANLGRPDQLSKSLVDKVLAIG